MTGFNFAHSVSLRFDLPMKTVLRLMPLVQSIHFKLFDSVAFSESFITSEKSIIPVGALDGWRKGLQSDYEGLNAGLCAIVECVIADTLPSEFLMSRMRTATWTLADGEILDVEDILDCSNYWFNDCPLMGIWE